MRCELVGVQDMNFQTREKDTIDGVKLHYLTVEDNTYGQNANTGFISRNVFDSFGITVKDLTELIGKSINLEFNNKKRICGITA